MPRFFLPPEECYDPHGPLPERIVLTGENAFHLSVSLRARVGEEVTVLCADGTEILCRIRALSGGKKAPEADLEPLSMEKSRSEAPVFITLFQGMPKGKKTDSILQKCTELGVGRVVFVYSDRSVPEPAGEEKKIARFEKIAEEAAKQSGRSQKVRVSILPDLDSAIPLMKESDLSFACYEEESEKSLKDWLSGSFTTASFFIGPEGGISPREAELLRKNGIPTVTLGKRILRTETAASAVLSMFLYEKEL